MREKGFMCAFFFQKQRCDFGLFWFWLCVKHLQCGYSYPKRLYTKLLHFILLHISSRSRSGQRVGNSKQSVMSRVQSPAPALTSYLIKFIKKCLILTYIDEKVCLPCLPCLPNGLFLNQSSSEIMQLPLSKFALVQCINFVSILLFVAAFRALNKSFVNEAQIHRKSIVLPKIQPILQTRLKALFYLRGVVRNFNQLLPYICTPFFVWVPSTTL